MQMNINLKNSSRYKKSRFFQTESLKKKIEKNTKKINLDFREYLDRDLDLLKE